MEVGLGGRVGIGDRGGASSPQRLPFELLHGDGAEGSVDFHHCMSPLGAIGRGKMAAGGGVCDLSLLVLYHRSSAAQDAFPQSDTRCALSISAPKHSWVVVFPWFLCVGGHAEINKPRKQLPITEPKKGKC